MALIFKNGTKIIFLLLLTGVYSRISFRQWQDWDERQQDNRYQREEDASDWDQYYHNQLQTQLDPDQTELYQQNRGHHHRHQHQDRTDHSQDQIHSDRVHLLSRLLNSKKSPILVFISQRNGKEPISPAINPADNAVANLSPDNFEKELYIPAAKPAKELYIPAQPAENDAYILYNILRTTQADEDLDAKAFEQFEKTKELLRSAFALRCGQRASCEQKCPAKKAKCPKNCQKVEKKVKNECKKKCPEKPRVCERKCEKVVEKKVDECEKKVDECEEEEEEKCEANCGKVFDELDACPKPKKSCGPKCGKTMPPNWLLRYGW